MDAPGAAEIAPLSGRPGRGTVSAVSEARRPNLFILGAPRCGTSAMFEFLGAHPAVFPARMREPRYFVPDSGLSLSEYLALFAGATDERWLLEASAQYLATPEAPSRVRRFSPDGRAIVMVRNPVDLVHSWHDRLTLLQRESADLQTALERGDLEARYLRVARLGEQLERVLRVFPREAVHVVVHDDFVADNAAEYRRVLRFLEIDSSFAPRFHTVNPSAAARSGAVQRALWREGGAFRGTGRRLLPRAVRLAGWHAASRLNRRPRPRAPLDDAVARSIWLRLEPDVELLGGLLDRDLVALWRR